MHFRAVVTHLHGAVLTVWEMFQLTLLKVYNIHEWILIKVFFFLVVINQWQNCMAFTSYTFDSIKQGLS